MNCFGNVDIGCEVLESIFMGGFAEENMMHILIYLANVSEQAKASGTINVKNSRMYYKLNFS